MNEVDLIKEVEKRPILYDKSFSGFNKTKLRDEAWKEIEDSLDVSVPSSSKTQLVPAAAKRKRISLTKDKRKRLINKRDEEDSEPEEERRPPRPSPAPVQNFPQTSLPDLSYQEKSEDESPEPSPKKSRLNSEGEETGCQCNRTDPDELFLLSCAPTLKRLNSKQNAVARLKIQQALYGAEFGTQMELPYVTPASECGYDNTESSVE